jgi:hypothetical protein
MRFEHRTAGENTEFWVYDADPEQKTALETLVWESRDDGWVKSFRCPVPEQAARAFTNIQYLLEPLLRQCIGATAVPWQAALETVCRRLETSTVDWWLCGSTALAVRDIPVVPRDLDLVVAYADAVALGGLLADGLIEPVCPAGWSISKWWGRAFLHARVEWVGASRPRLTSRTSPILARPLRTACKRSAGATGRYASLRCTSSAQFRSGVAWPIASP